MVENAFALLQMTFRDLHGKCNLNVYIVPDVVVCCAILHNILLKDLEEDVQWLQQIVQIQNELVNAENAASSEDDLPHHDVEDMNVEVVQLKKTKLGSFLSLQQIARI